MGWLLAFVLGIPILCCCIEIGAWGCLKPYVLFQRVLHGLVVALLLTGAGLGILLLLGISEDGTPFAYQGALWWGLTFSQVYASFFVDSLAALFLIGSLALSALVCLFAQGVFQNPDDLCRFMVYVCLGLITTLFLIASAQLLVVFVFWALLGVVVSLFVGFIYKNQKAQKASLRIFITNRVADIAFIGALWGCYQLFKDFEIEGFIHFLPHYTDQSFLVFDCEVLTLPFMAFCLAIACLMRASQLGFHRGLYQTIEAPLAASALIFTVFSLAVSVYLICRFSPLFDLVPGARILFLGVGLVTSLFMAMVASLKHNIKRILACGACSQMGYIFVALGLSGYGIALFQSLTYMVYQALLFLGGASIMRAMSQEWDIRCMGGLRDKIPLTYLFMGIGCFSLVGVPFFSGFFSKIPIFELALGSPSFMTPIVLGLGILSLFLTAYYALRFMWAVFHGSVQANEHVTAHIQESPPVMVIPMGLLAFAAIVGGYLGSGLFLENHYGFWGESLDLSQQEMALALAGRYAAVHPWVGWMGGLLLVSFLGFFMIHLYGKGSFLSQRLVMIAPELYGFIKESGYGDWMYDAFIIKPLWITSAFLRRPPMGQSLKILEYLSGAKVLRAVGVRVWRWRSLSFPQVIFVLFLMGILGALSMAILHFQEVGV